MSDNEDPAADTAQFQAFQDAGETSRRSPNAFRLLTLLGGVAVFVVLVLLLLR